ncbi:MAG: 2Fe-2S iron-sulfur cluster-binding protein, partial [Nitrospiraceae bacterium]|nr:2Fe-2S iron-sulfur cluster-binding protein [Nitrospiraceae bacterium]
MTRHRVIFQPSGRRGEVEDGTNLLDAARNLGVDIESICGGKGTCGKCKVRVEEGFFEKDSMDSRMGHLSPLTGQEMKFLKPSDGPAMRLACAAQVHGDVKIFVPEKSRAGKQIVRKAAKELSIAVEPAVRKYFVELAKPSLNEPITGDFERLREALRRQAGVDALSMDFPVLRDLQDAIRKGNWGVTVTLWKGREIIKVEPGFVEAAYGLAVDVGTTTVVGYLTDLATGKVVNTGSMMNPQVPYGEDVMSRITYAMTNEGGVQRMQKAIIDGLNEIIANVTKDLRINGGASGGEAIVDLTIVFNTAMHHIFLGFNPEHIGRSPFIPAIQHGIGIKARD